LLLTRSTKQSRIINNKLNFYRRWVDYILIDINFSKMMVILK
jgi:hypothetical protein